MNFGLSSPYPKTIIADLAQTLGVAILDIDYSLSTSTLTFLPGETTKTVTFTALTDLISESNEAILLNIIDNTRVVYGLHQNATITITNVAPVIPALPTVSTPTATAITQTSATLGANVESLGTPASISARGICIGTSSDLALLAV